MRGVIFSYDHERRTGLIRGENDNYYSMSADECKSLIQPVAGMKVHFESDGDRAMDISIVSPEAVEKNRDLHVAAHEDIYHHHEHKKEQSALLPWVIAASIVALIAVVVYSEIDRRHSQEIQDKYHQQIQKIEADLKEGLCANAKEEYKRSKETRDAIFEQGLYYSLDSHAKQAHALEIAECFAGKNEFFDAINMLDLHGVHDPDYLVRAAAVYEKAGEGEKAKEAKAMADKYLISK